MVGGLPSLAAIHANLPNDSSPGNGRTDGNVQEAQMRREEGACGPEEDGTLTGETGSMLGKATLGEAPHQPALNWLRLDWQAR